MLPTSSLPPILKYSENFRCKQNEEEKHLVAVWSRRKRVGRTHSRQKRSRIKLAMSHRKLLSRIILWLGC